MKDVDLLLIIRLINQYFFVDQDIYDYLHGPTEPSLCYAKFQ